MTPRYGAPPETARRYTRRPGAYAILERNGSILLTHQARPIPEFQLPGGGIDPGESPVASLHREVLEETGWSISKPRRLGVYRRYTFMPEYDLWAEKICHIYLARPSRRHGPPSEAGHEAIWTDLVTASRLLASEGDAAFLSRVLR